MKKLLLWLSVCALLLASGSEAFAKGTAGRLDPGFGKKGKVVSTFPSRPTSPTVDYQLRQAPGAQQMTVTTGAGVVVAGPTKVVYYDSRGRKNAGFGSNGVVELESPAGTRFELGDVAVDLDGRVLIAGGTKPWPPLWTQGQPFTGPNPSEATVTRLLADGQPDPTFGSGGTVRSDFGILPPRLENYERAKAPVVAANAIAIDPENRPLLGVDAISRLFRCQIGPYTATEREAYLVRLSEQGAMDPPYGASGKVWVPRIESVVEAKDVMGTGALLLGRTHDTCSMGGPSSYGKLIALDPAGTVDTSFGGGGYWEAGGGQEIQAYTFGHAAKPVILTTTLKGKAVVTRVLPNGQLDPLFGRGGWIAPKLPKHAEASALTLDLRGRIVVAGTLGETKSKLFLLRLTRAGKIDRTFGRRGMAVTGFGARSSVSADEVTVDPRGRIVVGGRVTGPRFPNGVGFGVARYLSR